MYDSLPSFQSPSHRGKSADRFDGNKTNMQAPGTGFQSPSHRGKSADMKNELSYITTYQFQSPSHRGKSADVGESGSDGPLCHRFNPLRIGVSPRTDHRQRTSPLGELVSIPFA